MRKILLGITLFLALNPVFGQKYLTQSGKISFFSEAPLENIEAINNQVSSVIDLGTGKVAFSLLISAFSFEKALMQEHFNEKYMESDKFPKSTFDGQFAEPDRLLSLSEEPTEIKVSGTVTIHGIKKDITTVATLKKTENGAIEGFTEFNLRPEDFDISIPAAKRDNIAKTIEVTVNATYDKME